MSEALPPDPDIAMLARIAALDMSAAEHAHARLLAADEAAEIAELGRTYQRLARSLRQTLALKAKLTRELQQAARGLLPRTAIDTSDIVRIGELQDAVARIALAAGYVDETSRDNLFERFDVEIDDWSERPDFVTADLDAQVRAACRVLGLSPSLAVAWRDLPHPADTEAPWAEDEIDAADESPPPRSASAASSP